MLYFRYVHINIGSTNLSANHDILQVSWSAQWFFFYVEEIFWSSSHRRKWSSFFSSSPFRIYPEDSLACSDRGRVRRAPEGVEACQAAWGDRGREDHRVHRDQEEVRRAHQVWCWRHHWHVIIILIILIVISVKTCPLQGWCERTDGPRCASTETSSRQKGDSS